MSNNAFLPIADAPIDRVIIVRRGHTLARVKWQPNKLRTNGFWVYDIPDGNGVEEIDFAPTHYRELEGSPHAG